MADGAAPLLKSFHLVGLHGYKNIRLEFQGKTKIVIAENGAGKTIFLSALDAFLTSKFDKLSAIQFERVECELEGQSTPLVLHRRQLQLPDITEETRLRLSEFSTYANEDPIDVRSAILRYQGGDIRQSSILYRAYVNSPWSEPETVNQVRQFQATLDTQSDEAKHIRSTLKAALGKTRVLYLPTYRRVELSRSKPKRTRSASSARLGALQGLEDTFDEDEAAASAGINYGLADVEARLLRLTEFIQRRSNIGYREISAAIIDDLLAGRFASADFQSEPLPQIDSLRLFFSRIQQSAMDAEQRLDAIAQLYGSGQIEEPTNGPLRYFLARLSKVVNQTKEMESDIENFVKISNQYLQRASDQKLLHYDVTQMKVKVINVWTGTEIRFDDLSSGEKQVISLFSHLYLSQAKQIILIDEPELSLSIEWQKRLLPDVVRAPTCRQLLAITHSPFVFDNELDPYASPLDVTRTKRRETST